MDFFRIYCKGLLDYRRNIHSLAVLSKHTPKGFYLLVILKSLNFVAYQEPSPKKELKHLKSVQKLYFKKTLEIVCFVLHFRVDFSSF